MTITVDVESNIRAQVIKQMNKLINVLQATDVTEGPGVNRELILVRVRANQDSRTAILKEAEIFQARVVDSITEDLVLEVTGEQEKLEEFMSLITGYGAVEITRSGIVSMPLDNKKLRLSPPVPRGAGTEEALQLQETE
jgi:acetolactate synthase I/III small subunit